ncbi:MAG: hypothetical protein AB201_03230 [Parcubacteria bacterium C7867-006]|nr:MAG: hypothetical protein AB201_03230 [Parcubacteria bacterium C7867-006]
MKKLSPISNKITKKTLAFAVMFVLMFSYVSPNAFAEDVISSTPCVTTDTLGDTHVEDVGTSPEPTFASIVSDYGISIGSQTQYQIWHTNKATTTFEITFLNGYTAAGDVFGYYKKGNINSFVPLFKNGSTNSVYPAVTQANPGQVYTVTLPAGDYGFAMHMEFGGHAYRTSETSLNENGEDNIISYNVSNSPQTYILGLEDLPFSVSDRDYNDIVVKIKTVSCEQL